MADKINWAALEAAYITSDKSYRTIAAEFKVSQAGVSKVGKRDGWPEKREKYRKTNADRAVARQASREVNKLEKLIEAADWMNGVLAVVQEDPQQLYRHLVTTASGSTAEKVFKKLDTKAIRDLAGAMKDMTVVTRNLNEIPTAAEKAGMVDKSIVVRFESGGEMEEYKQ